MAVVRTVVECITVGLAFLSLIYVRRKSNVSFKYPVLCSVYPRKSSEISAKEKGRMHGKRYFLSLSFPLPLFR